MASSNSTSNFKPCLVLLISCTFLHNLIQTCYAASDNNFNPTKNKNGSGFNWHDKKTWLPSDPLKCADSFRQAGVCLTDFWTNVGRPSTACCDALKNIDSSCWPALLPLLNPLIGHFLGGLCSFASGGLFPFPPFTPRPSATPPPPPFHPSGVAGATPSPPPPSPPSSEEDEDC